MQSLIDNILRAAKGFMVAFKSPPHPTIVWFKDDALIAPPRIMHSTNGMDHGSAEDDKIMWAYLAGFEGRLICADTIIFLWPCKAINVPITALMDATIDPETYPPSMCKETVTAFGINLKTEKTLIDSFIYSFDPWKIEEFTNKDALMVSFNLKGAVMEGYNL